MTRADARPWEAEGVLETYVPWAARVAWEQIMENTLIVDKDPLARHTELHDLVSTVLPPTLVELLAKFHGGVGDAAAYLSRRSQTHEVSFK